MRQNTLRRVNRILIVFALISVMSIGIAVQGASSYSISVHYTEFNSDTFIQHNVPSGNYTAPYTIEIDTSGIVWNDTTTVSWINMQFRNASDETAGEIIGIKMMESSSVLQVLSGTTGTPVIIGSTKFTITSIITIEVSVDGFTVDNGTAVQLEYFTPSFDINGVWVNGVAFSVEGGIANLAFDDTGGDYGIDILVDFMPLLVTIAVLGMVMKSFDRLGGKR